MTILEEQLERYHQLNGIAENGSAVFFGGDFFASMPVSELRQDYAIDMPLYNRSIRGLKLSDAEKYLPDCVYALNPSRIFINLGETDLAEPTFDLKNFLSAYEWLLYILHSHCRGRIHIVSVVSNHPMAEDVNNGLRGLAAGAGCEFIDIESAAAQPDGVIRAFERFRYHLHARPIGFAEAFSIG